MLDSGRIGLTLMSSISRDGLKLTMEEASCKAAF